MSEKTSEHTVDWIDEAITHRLTRPEMYGSPLAIETQMLLLLDLRGWLIAPAGSVRHSVQNGWVRFLRTHFEDRCSRPLSSNCTDMSEFIKIMRVFIDETRTLQDKEENA